MQLKPVPSEIATLGLRAIKTTFSRLNKYESFNLLQLEFVEGLQKFVLQSKIDFKSLNVITAPELGAQVSDRHFQERILKGCVIAACIDGKMHKDAISLLEDFAKAFKLPTDIVATSRRLSEGKYALARMDIIRKSLPGVKLKQTFQEVGLLGTIKQFLPLLGFSLNQVSTRYKKLAQYPKDSLGYHFSEYIKTNQFPWPGEKGAGPEIIVVHDCLHILGDYGTSASEEIEVASFQAGCQGEDPIYGLLFGLAQYHLGIRMAPVAPALLLQANPLAMLSAFARGCQVRRDMWRDFEPWQHFHKPIESLRQEFGIVPKL